MLERIADHVVRVLLASGANPNAATTPSKETAGFMRAAAFGTEDAIQMLLEAGARKEANLVGHPHV